MKDRHPADRLEAARKKCPLGLYRHYKRGDYILYSVSLRESDMEPVVSYYSIGRMTRWTRPVEEFAATVDSEGGRVFRFERVSACTAEQLTRAAGITT